MTFTYQQQFDGAWAGAANGGTWDVINPATEEVVRTVTFARRNPPACPDASPDDFRRLRTRGRRPPV